jgi:tetratricopeptide (TPR) repeat protein
VSQAHITIAGLIGALAVAIAAAGFSTLLSDSPSFQSWVGPSLIAIGAVIVAADVAWLLRHARKKNNRADTTPAAIVENHTQTVTTEISGKVSDSSTMSAGRDVHYYEAGRPEPVNSEITYWARRPASLGKSFVGRNADLDAIAGDFGKSQAVIVSGGAGFGKSQLAAEYTHEANRDGFWTSAGQTLEQTLAALARDLGVDEENRTTEDVAEDVKRHLANLSPDTLWVIDNLGDINLVNGLLSAVGPVRLLVTTRDDRDYLLSGVVAFRPIGVLDQESAIELLCSRSETDHRHDPALPEIVEAVGRLTLALEMLAVRLGEYGRSPKSLLDEIQKSPTPVELEAFRKETEGTAIPRVEGVFATIAGTLGDLPADVRARLSPLGYVADAPVPDTLLAALTGLDEDGVVRLVAECRRRSVVSLLEGRAVIHALTIAAVAATNADGAMEVTLNRAQTRLAAINLSDPVALREELSHYQAVFAHVSNALGTDHTSVLELAISLANGYYAIARYKEMTGLCEETLSIMKQVQGPEHPDTLRSRNNLAVGYRSLGRYDEAIRLNEETLSIMKQVQGPEHPDTLTSRTNVAVGYRALGRYDDAIGLDEETLAIMERVLGPEHPDTLGSRNNLANGYYALSRYDEAIGLYEETLSIMKRVLGPEHPDTLTSRNNLADDYHALGRYDETVGLHEETLAIMERVLGPEHPHTLSVRNNLANGYYAVGRYAEAIGLHEETLSIRERVLGLEHPDTLTSRNNLASGYRAVGCNKEADALEGKS